MILIELSFVKMGRGFDKNVINFKAYMSSTMLEIGNSTHVILKDYSCSQQNGVCYHLEHLDSRAQPPSWIRYKL